MIAMNDFKKEYLAYQGEYKRAVENCLNSGFYILGQQTTEFEKKFASFVGAKYCIGVANGLEALQISLMSLGITSGDEIITVANTAVATALSISHTGAKVVFVDVDKYHHINIKKIEEKITPKTKAIMPVHLFGQMVDMKELLKIARKYNLQIVEDACQAHGASFQGKKAGTFGKLGCFSFYPTKNLGGFGDGGAIVTNSKKLYERCRLLRNYGQANRYEHSVKGLNSRLDELQSAILNVKLSKLNSLIKRRQQIAKLYIKCLKDIPQVSLPETRLNYIHTYHLFVIEALKRDELQKYLLEKGIQTLIHYPIPIHKQDCYGEYKSISLPETEHLSKNILSLPIHPFMTTQQVLKVCQEIKNFYTKKRE